MCRSIKTLRPPYTEQGSDADIRAAALQYVRKVSGFRVPAARNAEAFGQAVDAVAAATATLLGRLEAAPAAAGYAARMEAAGSTSPRRSGKRSSSAPRTGSSASTNPAT